MNSIMLKFQKTRKISLGIVVLFISCDLVKADDPNNYSSYNPIIAAQNFGSKVYDTISRAEFATPDDMAGNKSSSNAYASASAASANQMQGALKYDDSGSIGIANMRNWDKSKLSKSKSSGSGMNQAEYGDETRLLEALGENPDDYQELIGGVVYSQWQKLAHNIHKTVSFGWTLKDLATKSGSQVTIEKKRRADGAVKFYKDKFKDKAYEVLRKDIDAFEDKIKDSGNKTLQKQLEFLLGSAKDAAFVLGKETAASRLKKAYNNFRPSVNGESIEESLAQADSSMRLAYNEDDRDAVDLYSEVLKKLTNVKIELDNIKRRSKNSLSESLRLANASLATAKASKENSKIELYDDIVAVIAKEEGNAKAIKADIAIINARVEELLKRSPKSPAAVLVIAEADLAKLEKDLHTLHNTPGGLDHEAVQKNNDAIRREKAVIAQLKEKVRESESDDRFIAQRAEDLLAKHDNDSAAALEEIQDSIKLLGRAVSKVDIGVKEVLAKRVKDEQKVVENYDAMKKKVDEEVKKIFNAETQNPSDIIKMLNEKGGGLKDAQDAVANGKTRRFAPSQMKPLQEKVDFYNAVEKELESELKKFNDKVSKKLNVILLRSNQDDKKALQFLLSTVKSGGGYWNAFVGESDDVKIKKLTDPVDKEIAARLQRRIKENVVNDPAAIAISKLNAASSPIEIMTGMHAVIDGALAKAGSPVRVGTLSPDKRMELARTLGGYQKTLLAISQEPVSAVAKHEKKKAVIKQLLEDASKILSQDITGVSYEALKTGNAQVIAMDLALNKLVSTLAPNSSLSTNVDNYDYVDPKAEAYETLGLQPDASQAEIRAAYLLLAKINHPDKGGDSDMFKRINEAYNLLKE